MKIHYVVGKMRSPVHIPTSVLSQLPEHVCLFLTAQFLDQQSSLHSQLTATGKRVDILQTRHTAFTGQIYGCSTQRIEAETNASAFFYIGDGVFHPYALLFGNSLPVHAFNPFTEEYTVYTQECVAGILKNRKVAQTKFLHAKTVGVLVTTKSGQNRMAFAERLSRELPDKTLYLFLTETLDFDQLENFPYIDIWVNTMCPRIGFDDTRRTSKPVLNMEDVSSFVF